MCIWAGDHKVSLRRTVKFACDTASLYRSSLSQISSINSVKCGETIFQDFTFDIKIQLLYSWKNLRQKINLEYLTCSA